MASLFFFSEILALQKSSSGQDLRGFLALEERVDRKGGQETPPQSTNHQYKDPSRTVTGASRSSP